MAIHGRRTQLLVAFGKQELLALGAYPDASLRSARDKREEAAEVLASGVDPSLERKLAKAALRRHRLVGVVT